MQRYIVIILTDKRNQQKSVPLILSASLPEQVEADQGGIG